MIASTMPFPQPTLSIRGSGLLVSSPRSRPAIQSRYGGLEVAGVVTLPRPPPFSQMW